MQSMRVCTCMSTMLYVEQLYLAQLEERARERDEMESTAQMKEALEKQMEQHREQHQKQLVELRHEIADKQHRIEQLAEYVDVMFHLLYCMCPDSFMRRDFFKILALY